MAVEFARIFGENSLPVLEKVNQCHCLGPIIPAESFLGETGLAMGVRF